MLQNLVQRQSVTRGFSQEPGDEVLGLGADMRRILHLHSGDSLVSFIVRLRFEWRFSHEKLVGKDSQTPEINLGISRIQLSDETKTTHLVIMERSLNHLWGQIVQCATHGT